MIPRRSTATTTTPPGYAPVWPPPGP